MSIPSAGAAIAAEAAKPKPRQETVPKYESAYYQTANVGTLLGVVDPVANAARAFHPAVIRAYKAYKALSAAQVPPGADDTGPAFSAGALEADSEVAVQAKERALRAVLKVTEQTLLYMNPRMQKFYMFNEPILGASHAVSQLVLDLIGSSGEVELSVEELHLVCAALLVHKPRSRQLWHEADLFMDAQLAMERRLVLSDSLLVAYCFQTALDSRLLRRSRALERLRARLLSELVARKEALFEQDPGMQADMINFVGESVTYPSRLVENLSMFLKVLSDPLAAAPPDAHGLRLLPKEPDLRVAEVDRNVGNSMRECARAALSSLSSPVHLSSLRHLWEAASALRMHEGYLLHKALFERVHASLLANPMQLVNEELAVVSLLGAMVRSKVKNVRVLELVFAELQKNNVMKSKHGLVLYNLFTELDMRDMAAALLGRIMDGIQGATTKGVFNMNRFAVLDMSSEAKTSMYEMLRAKKTAYTYSDFLITLHCFSRGATRPQYRLFCVAEETVVRDIASLRLSDVLGVYQSYASLGRKYPDMLLAVDRLIAESLHRLDYSQLVRLVWCSARLNHKPAYLSAALDRMLDNLPPMNFLRGHSSVTQIMWSLAVLQELTVARFLLLEKYLNQWKFGTEPTMHNQLAQAILELKLSVGLEDDSVAQIAKRWSSVSGGCEKQVGSSFYHSDISKVLREMGVNHRNEVQLNHGILVDIYIADDRVASKNGYCGLVIEVDGPVHYESYLMEPTGPTVMKRRHLKALHYEVLSIPCFDNSYSLKASSDEKAEFMRKLLKRSVYLSPPPR